MQISIMGAGAVGSYIGHKLSQIRANVTLIARGEHLKAMQRNGLLLESIEGEKVVPVKATDSIESIRNSDLIIYTVKAYHNESVAKQISEYINPYAKVLCLQNGVNSWKNLEGIIGKNSIIPGLIYIEAELKDPGKVSQHGNVIDLIFGAVDKSQGDVINKMSDIFMKSNIPFTNTTNIFEEIWKKCFFICVLAGMTCAYDTNIASILENTKTNEILKTCMKEIELIGIKKGYQKDSGVTDTIYQYLCDESDELIASMKLDLDKGNKIELDALNGTILELAKETNIKCPINTEIYNKIVRIFNSKTKD